jgi:hypothetical protein
MPLRAAVCGTGGGGGRVLPCSCHHTAVSDAVCFSLRSHDLYISQTFVHTYHVVGAVDTCASVDRRPFPTEFR